MRTRIIICSVLMAFALMGCKHEDESIIEDEAVYGACVEVDDFVMGQSRSALYQNGHFGWSANDALGVFPENGYQIAFNIEPSGYDVKTAYFNGGDWGLKNGHKYAAYYPYTKEAFNNTPGIVPFSYDNQVQSANNDTQHLGSFDLMASKYTVATPDIPTLGQKGYVALSMSHYGSVVNLKTKAPKNLTLKNLTITSNAQEFVHSLNLHFDKNSTEIPAVGEVSANSSFNVALNNIAVQKDDVISLWFMMRQANVGNTWNYKITTVEGINITGTVSDSQTFAPGYVYIKSDLD